MVYIWLVALSAVLIYLFYKVNVLYEAVDQLQELALEELKKVNNELDSALVEKEKQLDE